MDININTGMVILWFGVPEPIVLLTSGPSSMFMHARLLVFMSFFSKKKIRFVLFNFGRTDCKGGQGKTFKERAIKIARTRKQAFRQVRVSSTRRSVSSGALHFYSFGRKSWHNVLT